MFVNTFPMITISFRRITGKLTGYYKGDALYNERPL
jgi:hypothetical protein